MATVLSCGLQPKEVFEVVLTRLGRTFRRDNYSAMPSKLRKQPECAYNPFRMLPAAEDVLRKMMPTNAYRRLAEPGARHGAQGRTWPWNACEAKEAFLAASASCSPASP